MNPTTLYIFNPEHDYALAHDSDHFVPLQSALRFAKECAPFLRHLFGNIHIFCPYDTPTLDLSELSFDHIQPWGWDRLIRQQLRNAGVSESLLPSDSELDQLRNLAHRKMSIQAMEFLHEAYPAMIYPPAARLLTDIDMVESFVKEQGECIFKSPYSGNGRGNLYAHGELTPTLRRQCTGVLRRQKALLGEPLLNVVQDFAMEFHCTPQKVDFVGYSLFQTLHYGYAGNELRSDSDIEKILGQWVNHQQLESVRTALIAFMEREIQPHYQGCVGVDMFVYRENDDFRLNPMVEINLRMTMGMAAHKIYLQHVHPHSIGTMQLEYRPKPGDLQQFVAQQPAMTYQDNRWHEGFLALTPIDNKTQYAITVKIVSLRP